MLDVGSLDFTYSVLATSALYHTESEAVALRVSGYTWPDISLCVCWMSAFALALRERSPLQPKSFHGVNPDDAHHLQVCFSSVILLTNLLSPVHSKQKYGLVLIWIQIVA
jgi:cyclin E